MRKFYSRQGIGNARNQKYNKWTKNEYFQAEVLDQTLGDLTVSSNAIFIVGVEGIPIIGISK